MSNKESIISMLKYDGIAYVLYRAKTKLFGKRSKPLYSERALARLRSECFDPELRFGVFVTLRNTPEQMLREMIESLIGQVYPHWELCLTDESDDAHSYVAEVCMEYAARDPRIRYRRPQDGFETSADYIAVLGQESQLHPAALYEASCVIGREQVDFIYTDDVAYGVGGVVHCKPDFSADLLRSYDYIGDFAVFSRALLERSTADQSSGCSYDLTLRLTEVAKNIVHIPKPLHISRKKNNSEDSIDLDVMSAEKKALSEHLCRMGLKGTITSTEVPSAYRIRYEIPGEPLVSVIVSDAAGKKRCIRSVKEKTTYTNYEIVTDNEPNGEYLVLLDGNTEVITPDWIQQMLMYAQRSDVGAVGAMLWYPDDTVYSAGKILGLKKTAGDAHHGFAKGDKGYGLRMMTVQDYSAVSGKCMMIRRDLWQAMGGFDEMYGTLGDVDLCLRLREAGYRIIWTPYAEAYYHGGNKPSSLEATLLFRQRWDRALKQGDPFYHPRFHLLRGNFEEK